MIIYISFSQPTQVEVIGFMCICWVLMFGIQALTLSPNSSSLAQRGMTIITSSPCSRGGSVDRAGCRSGGKDFQMLQNMKKDIGWWKYSFQMSGMQQSADGLPLWLKGCVEMCYIERTNLCECRGGFKVACLPNIMSFLFLQVYVLFLSALKHLLNLLKYIMIHSIIEELF